MTDADIIDFIDHTAKYKGRVLTARLTVDCDGGTLRTYRGQDVPFRTIAFAGGNFARLNMVILVPASLDVPDAQSGDTVTVTFPCADGDLRHGNVAQKIERGR
jgi:hypothetical protein